MLSVCGSGLGSDITDEKYFLHISFAAGVRNAAEKRTRKKIVALSAAVETANR